MFLDESFDLLREEDQYPEITGDTACGMQLILEATEAYNKLDMAMIHLEHTAIVNEDANLLEEGKEGFKEKMASIGNTVKTKFLAWLDKLYSAWIKVQEKINTIIGKGRLKLVYSQLKKAVMKGIDIEEGINVGFIQQGVNVIANLKALANGINDENSISNINDKMKQLKFNYDDNAPNIPLNLLASVDNVLSNRAQAVKAIAVIKQKVKSFKDTDKVLISRAQQACVEASQLVNKVTKECMKAATAAFKAVRKANKEARGSAKEAKKAEKAKNKANKKAEGENAKKSESASILDAFMFD